MRKLADVVRLPSTAKKTFGSEQVIENIATLMERRAGQKQIRFQFELSSAPFYIEADEQQMEQGDPELLLRTLWRRLKTAEPSR
jgi:C4-dicarboxylate-specific signal transduction histidine kinase